MSDNPLKRRAGQPSREKRTGAVSAYYGNAEKLLEEWQSGDALSRIRTFSQSGEDDVTRAISLLSAIPGAAVVVHGPGGCGAAQLYHTIHAAYGEASRWSVTNLGERDTILGGDRALYDALVRIYRRYRPQAVFVVTATASAINNDDIRSVADELSEEWGIPVIPVQTDGFRSVVSLTGIDAALTAYARWAVESDKPAHPVSGGGVNLLAASESAEDIEELSRLIEAIGLGVQALPLYGEDRYLGDSRQAAASIAADSSQSSLLGELWESQYGVPSVRTAQPIGLANTSAWLTALGEAVGAADKARQTALAEEERARHLLDRYRLDGKKVYISLSGSIALAIADLVEELGGEAVGLTLRNTDKEAAEPLRIRAERSPGITIHVADGQPFEEINLLARLQPDLYIGVPGQTVWAARTGIPSISVGAFALRGYRGAVEVAKAAHKTLRNPALPLALAKLSRSPYKDGWLNKNPNWHIKQEVR